MRIEPSKTYLNKFSLVSDDDYVYTDRIDKVIMDCLCDLSLNRKITAVKFVRFEYELTLPDSINLLNLWKELING